MASFSSSPPSTARSHSASIPSTTSSTTSKATTVTANTNPSKPTTSPSHRLPTRATLRKAGEHKLYTADGEAVLFRSLYGSTEKGQRKRTLILFIRHFFCGNCQEYLRALSHAIPPSSLPQGTSIAIIGCGAPSLIPSYIEQLACDPPFRYPIFAEPSKKLYELLEMQYTLSLGGKSPEYMQKSLVRVNLASTVQGMKRVWKGDALKGGDMRLNGGEFLFESAHSEEVRIRWCHRMGNSRDHAEVGVLRGVLGTDQPQNQNQTQYAPVGGSGSERPGLGRRRSTAERLRRSFSNRRKSWLGRNGSWSRKGSQESQDNSRDASRRSPDRNIEVVREEVRSRDGKEKPAAAAINGDV